MLRWLVDKSLAIPKAVLAAAIALVVVCAWQLPQMKVDALPEYAPVIVQIQTEALGLSAQEVEQMITVPLEQDLLNGVAWVEHISSESVPGLSKIDLVFEPGTDPLEARQVVQERMTQAHALPNVSAPPQMIQPTSASGRVAMIGISSATMSPVELGVLARWTIRPKLMGVQGVANVAIWGQRERQVQVQVDPERLRAKGVTLEQVVHTAGNALLVSPLSFLEASTPGTGGFIDTPNQRLGVQHMVPIRDADDLAEVVVEDQPGQMRLGDVTTVVEEHQPLIGDALVASGNGFIIVVDMLPGANTREVASSVEAAMDVLAPGLTGVAVDTSLYRPASYVEQMTGNVRTAALLGAGLALLVLLATLVSWRRALVSFVAATLSLAAAMLVLHLLGWTLDALVLLGLAAAVVAVVDDGVSTVERLSRRNRAAGPGTHDDPPSALTSAEGSGAMAGRVQSVAVGAGKVIAFGSVVVAAAVLPLLLLAGLAADAFTARFGLTVLVALGTSLAVALTVTPALCTLLLRRSPEPALSRRWRGTHRRSLSAVVRRPVAVMGVTALAALGAVAFGLPGVMDRSLMPSLREPYLLVQWDGAPGTSLTEMARIGGRVGDELRALDGVSGVSSHFGRAVTSDTAAGANGGMVWVAIAEDADYDRTVAQVRQVVDGYPGMAREILTYSTERVSQHTASTTRPITVRIYGEDEAVLREQAERVRQVLAEVDGVVDPTISTQAMEPTIQIDVDLAKARAHGVKPGDVRRAATTLLSGIQVGSIFDRQKVFEVQVWSTPQARENISDVAALLIDTPSGDLVTLGDVAKVSVAPSPTTIRHDGVSRRLDVTADLRDRGVDAALADVQESLVGVSFPTEYHAEVLGDFADRQDAERTAMLFGAFALLVVFLLLQAAFESWRLAAIACVTIPACLLGGLVFARLAGPDFTVATGAGLLAVFAFAVRAVLSLVFRAQELADEGTVTAPYVDAASERATPVVVAAVAAAAVFLPVIVLGSVAGLELIQPFAVVVLGGLVSTVLAVLFLLPALCSRWAPAEAHLDAAAPSAPAAPALDGG